MKTDFASLELFCRVNVQSELPHGEFVSFIARSIGGVSHLNSVKSNALDISVDENDVFDAEKARRGKDRWLHFRYTMEIDPIEGVSPINYVTAIGNLLQSLWSSRMDAVASCDFEDRLPRNVRRLKWAWTPNDHKKVAGGTEIAGGKDIRIPPTGDPVVVLDACAESFGGTGFRHGLRIRPRERSIPVMKTSRSAAWTNFWRIPIPRPKPSGMPLGPTFRPIQCFT